MASDPVNGSGLIPEEEQPGRVPQDPVPAGPVPAGTVQYPARLPAPAVSPETDERPGTPDRARARDDGPAAAQPPQNFIEFLYGVVSRTRLCINLVMILIASAAVLFAMGWGLIEIGSHIHDGFTAVVSKSGITIPFTGAGTVAVTVAVAVRVARKRSRARRAGSPNLGEELRPASRLPRAAAGSRPPPDA